MALTSLTSLNSLTSTYHMNTTEDMNTRLTKEDQAIIKKARRYKVSEPIYSEDRLRLLKVLGNPEIAMNSWLYI